MVGNRLRAATLDSLPEEGSTSSQNPASTRIVGDDDLPSAVLLAAVLANETTLHASNVFEGNSTMHSTTQHSIPTIASETVHVSNVQLGGRRAQDDKEDTLVSASPYNRYIDDDEDRADKIAAWAIHIALLLFCGLVIVSLVLAFLAIRQYGLVAMMALLLIGTFSIFLAWFVDKTVLRQDAHFKPIRRKILGVVTAAQQVVVEEYTLFQQDWNEEYLLLTNGESSSDENENNDEEDQQQQQAAAPTKKKRSVIFQLVKPLLGIRRKVFRRKEKKRKNLSPDYQPPITEHEGVAV
jgi:hypothetical protein